ncbi:MAG: thiolase family protein [Acidimicrobiales bacterium]|nr:thiolase family protein [Hyphomonadaceae bacterium]RZV41652.1 MAG: thiolase family protein [Acidimicrobiales bacterium]
MKKIVYITGVGQSEVKRPSLKSGAELTIDACLEAVADAGLQLDDIDGVACWPGDNNNGAPFSPIGPVGLKTLLGLDVKWFGGGYEGPGPIAGIINGAMAIEAGLCRHVLVFRTITESSARLKDKTVSTLGKIGGKSGRDSNPLWMNYTPFNVHSATILIAMYAQKHFHDYGLTSEQLGQIAMTCRANAADNPKAIYKSPMSLDDYMSSRVIASPLRLFDCDVHCDASTAIILSRKDCAKDTRRDPVLIEAVGAGNSQPWSWDQISLTHMITRDVAKNMWSNTDLKPKDVDCAQLYDGFSILTLIWMEALGLCGIGEGGAFIEGGQRISRTGEMPINTNGGQLSGGRTHGLGYVHEACQQIWGRAGDRQLTKCDTAVVAAGGGPLGGSTLLRRADL